MPKNVVCLFLSPDKTQVMVIKTPCDEKLCWSIPNQRYHHDVTKPRQKGKEGAKILFEMFSFGLMAKSFSMKLFTKHILPSTNVMYVYECSDQYEKISEIFESISKNILKVDIKKIEFHKINDFLNVKAFSLYHYETIEAVRYYSEKGFPAIGTYGEVLNCEILS